MSFVNVYLDDRAYGGPEEGGWWYDCGEAVRSTRVETDADTDAAMEREQAWCDAENEGRPPISSVTSRGRYHARVEEEPAADYPAVAPHYA